MPLSKPAYELGGEVICGGETVHDFASSTLCDGLADQERERFLREAFTELVAGGFITWSLECDYGNAPGVRPSAVTAECFLADWSRCFPDGIIRRTEVPDLQNWTLFIDPTDTLGAALDEYESTAA